MTAITISSMQENRVGTMLRDWRTRRRRSQLDLALDAGISTRHLSFVETGRSRPSAEMVLHLAERLEVPLRQRNELLLAAGYAPRYPRRDLGSDPELARVRDAVARLLAGHEPFPALAVDQRWTLVASNAALGILIDGVDDELLVPPVNCLRLALHPGGIARRVRNLAEWRGHLLHNLARAIELTGDGELAALERELLGYPEAGAHGAHGAHGTSGANGANGPNGAASRVMVGLRLAAPDGEGEYSFFSTITTFGTPIDVTVAGLSIEAFFPADEATAAALRAGAPTTA